MARSNDFVPGGKVHWGDCHLCCEEDENPSQHFRPVTSCSNTGWRTRANRPDERPSCLQPAFESKRLSQRSQALDEKGVNKKKSPPLGPEGWKLACSFEAKSQLEDQQPARRSDALSAQPKSYSAQNHQRHAPRQLATRAMFQPDYKSSQNRAALPICIFYIVRRTTAS